MHHAQMSTDVSPLQVKLVLVFCRRLASQPNHNSAIVFNELVTADASLFRLASSTPLKLQHGQTAHTLCLARSPPQSDRFVYLLLTGSPLVSKWASEVHHGT